MPFLFLHVRYQPDLSFAAGGTSIDVTLSDLALLAVVATALAAGLRTGFAPLARGLPIWIATAVLLTVVVVSLSYPGLRGDHPYDVHARIVSALKFCEYAALALAVPLLVRGRDDARPFFVVLIGWSTVATGVGVLQFLGWVNEFEGRRPAQREPSLLGIHDLAALSGGALTLGFVALALDENLVGKVWGRVGLGSGGLGLVISGAVTGVIGMWLALGAVVLLAHRGGRLRRRAAAVLATAAVLVTLGTLGMRGSTLRDFAAFLGIHRNETPGAVESYAQRTVLGYIGLRIFLAHPVTGVGYQGSNDVWAYGPELPAAHRRFPGQPEDAFPSPAHPWGIQNFYLETLADLGVIGGVALLGLFAASLRSGLGTRASAVAPVGVVWLLVAAGVWIGIGIVPGIPLAALTWLGVGLVAAGG